jgi:hypothetical protein
VMLRTTSRNASRHPRISLPGSGVSTVTRSGAWNFGSREGGTAGAASDVQVRPPRRGDRNLLSPREAVRPAMARIGALHSEVCNTPFTRLLQQFSKCPGPGRSWSNGGDPALVSGTLGELRGRGVATPHNDKLGGGAGGTVAGTVARERGQSSQMGSASGHESSHGSTASSAAA